jgi:probable rRNA maturation factor
LGSPDSELSILIVDDTAMAELNQTYRNRPGPTNVLAFSMHDGDFADIHPELLGDIVISADTAEKEADELGVSFDQRFDFLMVHGVLHLFGYDHERGDAAEAEMDAKTKELFQLINKIENSGTMVGKK